MAAGFGELANAPSNRSIETGDLSAAFVGLLSAGHLRRWVSHAAH